ncbi:hypothetical protein SacmaDRAFT_0993, partial [Saccharomonospora marina XMU15]
WLLAPGLFQRRLAGAGADVVAAPLGAHPAVVDLVLRRHAEALPASPPLLPASPPLLPASSALPGAPRANDRLRRDGGAHNTAHDHATRRSA